MAKKKIRVDLRKNRSKPPRKHGWTRGFQEHGFAEEATAGDERVCAKGDLSRQRTIIQDESTPDAEWPRMPAVDAHGCIAGPRPARTWALQHCRDRRRQAVPLLGAPASCRTLATDERSVVTTGDRVWFRAGAQRRGA